MIGEALLNLADIANCVSGDFHLMHLCFHGAEFDSMHKDVLKTYYEQAADDYDSWAEAALMFDDATIMNPNGSAVRISWQSIECSDGIDKQWAVQEINTRIETYLEAALIIFNSLNNKTDDYKCVGVVNALQTRIEYWSKELCYFNKRRV